MCKIMNMQEVQQPCIKHSELGLTDPRRREASGALSKMKPDSQKKEIPVHKSLFLCPNHCVVHGLSHDLYHALKLSLAFVLHE